MAKKKVKSKSYFDFFSQSFIDVKDNLVLFNTVFIGLVFFFLFCLILGIELLVSAYAEMFSYTSFSAFASNISSLQLSILIAFLFVDVLLLLVMVAYVRSMIIGMAKEIADKGRTCLKTMWQSGKIYFKNVFFVQLYVLFIFTLLPAALLGGITLLIYLANHTAGLIVGIFLLIIFILYLIFMGILLIFTDPVLVENNKKSPWTIVRKTLACFSFDPKTVFMGWVMVLLISLAARLIIEPFWFFFEGAGTALMQSPVFGFAVFCIILVIVIIISSLSNFISEVLVFHLYYKKHIKK